MIKFDLLKLFHGIVYASGNGIHGVLGDGITDEHYEGTPIPINTANMQGKSVIQVCSGFYHSLFLCEDGSVYASGYDDVGQLGVENGITDNNEEGTPIPINTANMDRKRETELTCQSVSQRVIQVAAGRAHSLFLCEDGTVYASGDSSAGQLGDGRTYQHYEGTPISIDIANMEGKRVIQVSAGECHSLFVCEDGSVYASGFRESGILGDGRTDRHLEGTPIPIDTTKMNEKRVIQVSAGVGHSLFLCEDGSVYASGQLGDGGTAGEGTPIPIDTSNMEGKRVIQVAAGAFYSLFLCEDGSVYASGWGGYGQLGDGRTDDHFEGTPIPIDTSNMNGKRETELTCQSVSQRVMQVSAGEDYSLFLCEDGTVYASGDGESGRLGDGRTDGHKEGTPIPIDTTNMQDKRVIQVSAGRFHSLFLT